MPSVMQRIYFLAAHRVLGNPYQCPSAFVEPSPGAVIAEKRRHGPMSCAISASVPLVEVRGHGASRDHGRPQPDQHRPHQRTGGPRQRHIPHNWRKQDRIDRGEITGTTSSEAPVIRAARHRRPSCTGRDSPVSYAVHMGSRGICGLPGPTRVRWLRGVVGNKILSVSRTRVPLRASPVDSRTAPCRRRTARADRSRPVAPPP